jgi:hypothetical protein
MPMVNAAVAVTFTAKARQLGIVSGTGSALLITLYAVTLIAGFCRSKRLSSRSAIPCFRSLRFSFFC